MDRRKFLESSGAAFAAASLGSAGGLAGLFCTLLLICIRQRWGHTRDRDLRLESGTHV